MRHDDVVVHLLYNDTQEEPTKKLITSFLVSAQEKVGVEYKRLLGSDIVYF